MSEDQSIIVESPDQIMGYHKLAQYHACTLELQGLKHSSGRSIIAHVRKTYKLSGSPERVTEQMREMLVRDGVLSS